MIHPSQYKSPLPNSWERAIRLVIDFMVVLLGILTLILPSPTLTFWYNPPPELKVELGWAKWVVGPIMIFYGLYFFVTTYRSSLPKKTAVYKCASCGQVEELEEGQNQICPNCNGPFEEIKGFFERHPEFKE